MRSGWGAKAARTALAGDSVGSISARQAREPLVLIV